MHLGESDDKDARTAQVVANVLLSERNVDLVVLSGDMVSGFANKYSIQDWFENKYAPVLAVIDSHGLPHAMTLGNHDDEGRLTRSDIVRLDQRSSRSVTRLGPKNVTGATNYWLDVHSGGHVATRLWFLDSMDRGCAGVPGWGCVRPDAVDWVREQLRRLPPVDTSLAFVHIPVPEFIQAWNYGASWGIKGEAVCCPSCNSQLFDALQAGQVTAVYSGHDHNNDYVALWRGMRLAYGRKTGYGSYGPPVGMKRGARVIVLRQGEPAHVSETYLRLEDRQAVSQSPSSKHIWSRLQWACEPGLALKRAMGAKIVHNEAVQVNAGKFGSCTVSSALPHHRT